MKTFSALIFSLVLGTLTLNASASFIHTIDNGSVVSKVEVATGQAHGQILQVQRVKSSFNDPETIVEHMTAFGIFLLQMEMERSGKLVGVRYNADYFPGPNYSIDSPGTERKVIDLGGLWAGTGSLVYRWNGSADHYKNLWPGEYTMTSTMTFQLLDPLGVGVPVGASHSQPNEAFRELRCIEPTDRWDGRICVAEQEPDPENCPEGERCVEAPDRPDLGGHLGNCDIPGSSPGTACFCAANRGDASCQTCRELGVGTPEGIKVVRGCTDDFPTGGSGGGGAHCIAPAGLDWLCRAIYLKKNGEPEVKVDGFEMLSGQYGVTNEVCATEYTDGTFSDWEQCGHHTQWHELLPNRTPQQVAEDMNSTNGNGGGSSGVPYTPNLAVSITTHNFGTISGLGRKTVTVTNNSQTSDPYTVVRISDYDSSPSHNAMVISNLSLPSSAATYKEVHLAVGQTLVFDILFESWHAGVGPVQGEIKVKGKGNGLWSYYYINVSGRSAN